MHELFCYWFINIVGSTFSSWIWNGKSFSSTNSTEDLEVSTSKRSRHNADLFGSVGYSFQHGKFTKKYGDLTRVDAHLNISSASAFAKKILKGSSEQPSASPRLNLTFQQQVNFFSLFKSNHLPVYINSLDVFESRTSLNCRVC